MFNIAIIGAGQLGSRHLQGLKSAQLPMDIWVMDSSHESLDIAKERYEQIEENPQIVSVKYVVSMSDIPTELDLVIVATGAAPRRKIIEELLRTKKSIKNIVLEKFLFHSMVDYDAVTTLLEKHNLIHNTWVNCPRRLFDGYKELKTRLDPNCPIELVLTGGDWGLACNTIHYLDLFAFLSQRTDVQVNCAELDPIIRCSKRLGYVEFTGTIRAITKRGDKMQISSIFESQATDSIDIINGNNKIKIHESDGLIICNGTKIDIGMKYQSGLTSIVAEQILLGKYSELASYSESSKLHMILLEALVPFYNNLSGKQGDSCPIT